MHAHSEQTDAGLSVLFGGLHNTPRGLAMCGCESLVEAQGELGCWLVAVGGRIGLGLSLTLLAA